MTVTHAVSIFGQQEQPVHGRVNAKRGPLHRSEFRKDGQEKSFVAFGFALLLTGLLVALDFALATRTVEQLARYEVYAGARVLAMCRALLKLSHAVSTHSKAVGHVRQPAA